jgi:Fe-S-cluster containining protein
MVTGVTGIYRTYTDLLSAVDKEFNRVREIFIDRMQCAKGCSSCCNQLFSISAIEAAYISRGVKDLEPNARTEMCVRALAYLRELTGVEPDDTQGIEAHSRIVEHALNELVGRHYIPCPALVDDACSIYSHRPVLARKFGIPLWNPKNPRVLQACELNFKSGEAIEVDGLIEPQIQLEYQWLEFKARVEQELGLPKLVATVASAVVFDYDQFLEDQIALRQTTKPGG